MDIILIILFLIISILSFFSFRNLEYKAKKEKEKVRDSFIDSLFLVALALLAIIDSMTMGNLPRLFGFTLGYILLVIVTYTFLSKKFEFDIKIFLLPFILGLIIFYLVNLFDFSHYSEISYILALYPFMFLIFKTLLVKKIN